MPRCARLIGLAGLTLVAVTSTAAAQDPAQFEDVVRNLRNPDPKVRISAVRLLRDAGYVEATAPIAPLINDPVNEIQLEALGAELSFYLVEPVPARRRVALLLEVRTTGSAPAAFAMGPLATWSKPVPSELADALIAALDDDNKLVRLEAIYTLGTIVSTHPRVARSGAQAPVAEATAQGLIKALDHYDPAIRAGAADVCGRLQVTQAGDPLIKAINDSSAAVRYAAMRALGRLRDERAVQALTDQLTFYGKGEGAWSALDALARIAHASSVPHFTQRLGDRDPYLRRAAVEGLARTGDTAHDAELERMASSDDEPMVRAAATFARTALGDVHYLARLADTLGSSKVGAQSADYLVELGPEIAPRLLPLLQDPDEGVRRRLAQVLGLLGDQTTVTALAPLKADRDADVARAATQAIERLTMAGAKAQ